MESSKYSSVVTCCGPHKFINTVIVTRVRKTRYIVNYYIGQDDARFTQLTHSYH